MATTSTAPAEYRIDTDAFPIELPGDILVPNAQHIRDYAKRVYAQYTRILTYLKNQNIRMYNRDIPNEFSMVVPANISQERLQEHFNELKRVMAEMAGIVSDIVMREAGRPQAPPTEPEEEEPEEEPEEEEGPDETPSPNKGKQKPQGRRTGGGGPPPDGDPSDDDNPFTPR
jgi:hypothetical protein